MAATITSTGTWTPLNVDWSRTPKTSANVMYGNMLQLEQLKNADLSELMQFVQAMADGYGVPFNVAKQVFYHIVVAFMNRETPAVSRAYVA